jgi:hypothetical protein
LTLVIAHAEGDFTAPVGVLDLIREARPPLSPDSVAQEFAATLKNYGISTVVGDRFDGLWPSEQFQEHGIEYQPADRSKSESLSRSATVAEFSEGRAARSAAAWRAAAQFGAKNGSRHRQRFDRSQPRLEGRYRECMLRRAIGGATDQRA